MEFLATEASDGAIDGKHHYMIGLGGPDTDQHFDDITYAIYVRHNEDNDTANRFYVYENGIYV